MSEDIFKHFFLKFILGFLQESLQRFFKLFFLEIISKASPEVSDYFFSRKQGGTLKSFIRFSSRHLFRYSSRHNFRICIGNFHPGIATENFQEFLLWIFKGIIRRSSVRTFEKNHCEHILILKEFPKEFLEELLEKGIFAGFKKKTRNFLKDPCWNSWRNPKNAEEVSWDVFEGILEAISERIPEETLRDTLGGRLIVKFCKNYYINRQIFFFALYRLYQTVPVRVVLGIRIDFLFHRIITRSVA